MGRGDEDNGYPRVLDAEGCVFGRHVMEEVKRIGDQYKELRKEMGKVKASLVGAAVAFGSAALMLALNLLLR
jgi:hypothetical protein